MTFSALFQTLVKKRSEIIREGFSGLPVRDVPHTLGDNTKKEAAISDEIYFASVLQFTPDHS